MTDMSKLTPEEWWHGMLTGENPEFPLRRIRSLLKLLPEGPRCKFCNAPFHGFGAPLMRMMGQYPSRLTPHLCAQCHKHASQHLGGAEVELTMLFADIRGSTSLAEKMSPTEFGQLISRFFSVAADIVVRSQALLDRLVGDQVIGLYIPGFAGENHRELAISAAQELLRVTGHSSPTGPWIPIGVGIHTGIAFVGSVGNAGVATDITVLGDAANTAARLSSSAKAGEVLVSENAMIPSLISENLESRSLELKGKSQPVKVFVLSENLLPQS
jgi:adenylate cyclase